MRRGNVVKEFLKKRLPEPMVKRLRKMRSDCALMCLCFSDFKRYANHYSSMYRGEDEVALGSWMMYCIHRIEKGLSHTAFREGFGERALQELSQAMDEWIARGYPADSYMLHMCESAAYNYAAKHVDLGLDIPSFYKNLFPEFSRFADDDGAPRFASTKTVQASEKTDLESRAFKQLFESRFSVREYGSAAIDRDALDEALAIATKTPSVCNRQSWRVLVIQNSSLIKQTLDLQGGWRGYDYPPALLLVTSDLRGFLSIAERNEPYVDGGIFLMSVLLSLESKGIAACTLNAMFPESVECEVRQVLSIPENEVLIAFIAIGSFPERVEVPASNRYPLDVLVRELE